MQINIHYPVAGKNYVVGTLPILATSFKDDDNSEFTLYFKSIAQIDGMIKQLEAGKKEFETWNE